VWALLFAGVLPFIVGVALTRRTVTGTLPMNARALRRFVVQRVAAVVIVAGIPVLCFVAAAAVAQRSSEATGALVTAGFAAFVVGALVCSFWARAIGIGGIVEDRPGWGRWVRLGGVDPTFAAAVQRMYAGRMPQWQVGTVPTSFAHVPLPAGYAPPPPPPGWSPPPWSAATVPPAPPAPR
jgi:succinate dehydrogenase hydrophobic anchor subunit